MMQSWSPIPLVFAIDCTENIRGNVHNSGNRFSNYIVILVISLFVQQIYCDENFGQLDELLANIKAQRAMKGDTELSSEMTSEALLRQKILGIIGRKNEENIFTGITSTVGKMAAGDIYQVTVDPIKKIIRRSSDWLRRIRRRRDPSEEAFILQMVEIFWPLVENFLLKETGSKLNKKYKNHLRDDLMTSFYVALYGGPLRTAGGSGHFVGSDGYTYASSSEFRAPCAFDFDEKPKEFIRCQLEMFAILAMERSRRCMKGIEWLPSRLQELAAGNVSNKWIDEFVEEKKLPALHRLTTINEDGTTPSIVAASTNSVSTIKEDYLTTNMTTIENKSLKHDLDNSSTSEENAN